MQKRRWSPFRKVKLRLLLPFAVSINCDRQPTSERRTTRRRRCRVRRAFSATSAAAAATATAAAAAAHSPIETTGRTSAAPPLPSPRSQQTASEREGDKAARPRKLQDSQLPPLALRCKNAAQIALAAEAPSASGVRTICERFARGVGRLLMIAAAAIQSLRVVQREEAESRTRAGVQTLRAHNNRARFSR